jgi:hypothetical protein
MEPSWNKQVTGTRGNIEGYILCPAHRSLSLTLSLSLSLLAAMESTVLLCSALSSMILYFTIGPEIIESANLELKSLQQ